MEIGTLIRRMTQRNSLEQSLIVGVCALFGTLAADAATWRFTPSVDASVTHNDNVSLAPAGAESSDTIMQLNPALSVTGTGRKLKLNLNYRMQNVFYSDNSDKDDTFHQLDSLANMEVVDEIFFLDVAGKYAQQNTSNTGTISFDNLSVNNNVSNVGSIRINPYLQHRLGNYADFKLEYQYFDVRYDGSTADTTENLVALMVNSGRRFNRFNWQLDLSRSEVNPDDRADISFQKYNAGVGYDVTNQFRTTATIGYEKNEYPRSVSADDPTNNSWSVGFVWKPSPITSVDASFGERFFGSSGALRVTHQTRRSDFSLRYVEDVTNLQQQEQYRQIYSTPATPADPTDPSQPLDTIIDLPSITSEVYIRKRLDANLRYTTAKSIFSINLYDEVREFQESGNEEKVYGIGGRWNWQFQSRTAAIIAATGQILDVDATGEKIGLARLSLTLERKMRSNMNGYLDLVHNRKDSNKAGSDYEQNTIAIRINARF